MPNSSACHAYIMQAKGNHSYFIHNVGGVMGQPFLKCRNFWKWALKLFYVGFDFYLASRPRTMVLVQ